MFAQPIPYAPLWRQEGINRYRSGGYVKTVGSTTETLGKLVKARKRGGVKAH